MLTVDFIGLLLTIALVGLRYPHYVLSAGLIHDCGRIVMAIFLNGHIESVTAAGAFGSAVVTGVGTSVKYVLVMMAGSLACYLVSAAVGGIGNEPTAKLIHPSSILKNPFAVVTLRLAIVSFVTNMWQLF